uniref:LIM zinc-binding domain-containing protein n=1 Tax=Parastrongyloides trichosuri TaxID=131310 RepID=A0A0N4ZAD5_PARTI
MSNFLNNNNLPPIMDKEALTAPYKPRSNVFHTVRAYHSDDVKTLKEDYLAKDISAFIESPKKRINCEDKLSRPTTITKINKRGNLSNNDLSFKSKNCKRCNEVVYEAEKVLTAGSVWHKRCFRCVACSKSLQLGQISERNNDIFCNNCYAKDYGPKGYGHGVNCGTLSLNK